jgi:hypothetical protein
LVVIDAHEQVVAEQRFVNDRVGYRSMRSFGRAFPDRTWAVEGARGVGAGLAQRLVAEGEPVLDVPRSCLPGSARWAVAAAARPTAPTRSRWPWLGCAPVTFGQSARMTSPRS